MSSQGPTGGRAAFGVLLVLLGAVSLVDGPWCRGKQRERWLAEKEQAAVTIDSRVIDPADDGKLVHATGTIAPREQEYVDPLFGVSARGFALVRRASTYANDPSPGGGGTGWYDDARPSVAGGSPEAADPGLTVVWMPESVCLGKFVLDPEIVSRLLREATGAVPPPDRDQERTLTPAQRLRRQLAGAATGVPTFPAPAQDVPPPGPAGWRRGPDGRFYSGRDLAAPAYGDRRVDYRLVRIDPGVVTLLCRQAGGRLEPGPGPRGRPFFTLSLGEVDRPAAFASAREDVRREAGTLLALGIALAVAGVGLVVWDVRAMRGWASARGRRATAGSAHTAVDPAGVADAPASAQESPQGAIAPFTFHAAHRQRAAEGLPPAPLRRSIPGTGEGALGGMIIVSLCQAAAVSGVIHLGWEAPYLWPTAVLLAAVDCWFLHVMIRLIREEGWAKRLCEQGQRLRGSVVRCVGYEATISPSSWEASPSNIYAVRLEYRFRTPEGREVVQKEERFAEDLKGQALAEPGARVLVLYLDDEHFEVM